jgi:RHS repeat-associated protein
LTLAKTVRRQADGADRRVSRSESGVTQDYLWDRRKGLPTIADDGTTAYVHGPTGLAEEVDGSGTEYPLRDGLGSIRARTDDTGTVTGTADHDVWGNARGGSGASGLYGWVGEPTDPATGLVNLRARVYYPGTGRFVQRDTVQPNGPGTQGWNPYAYTANNPTTWTDPSGHDFAELVNATIWMTIGPWISVTMVTSAAVTGEGPVLLAVAAMTNVLFLLAIVLLVLVAAMVFTMLWCDSHGIDFRACFPSAAAAFGVGNTWIGSSAAAAWASATTQVTDCSGRFSFARRFLSAINIANSCPKPPDDEECTEMVNVVPGDVSPPTDDDKGGDIGGGSGGGMLPSFAMPPDQCGRRPKDCKKPDGRMWKYLADRHNGNQSRIKDAFHEIKGELTERADDHWFCVTPDGNVWDMRTWDPIGNVLW